jgi:hypothetical protein
LYQFFFLFVLQKILIKEKARGFWNWNARLGAIGQFIWPQALKKKLDTSITCPESRNWR